MLNRNSVRDRTRNRFGFIAHRIMGKFTVAQPKVTDIPLGYIPRCVEVGIQGVTAVMAFDKSPMSGSMETSTLGTLFTGISRVTIDHPDAFLGGLVFDKPLELVECPLMHPFVVFGRSPDISQPLHNDYITAFQVAYNLLGDVVVDPSHKLFPTASDSLNLPVGSPCAFGLDFSHNPLVFHSQMLDAFTEPPIAGDSNIVNAEVDSNNCTVVTAVEGDLFGKCEAEEELAVLKNQMALSNLPREILPIAFRNFYGNLDPAFYCGNGENLPVLDGSATREVVSYGHHLLDHWLVFGSLDRFRGLFDGIGTKLCLQTVNPFYLIVAYIVEFDSVCDVHLPSEVNAELDGFRKDFHRLDNSVIRRNSYLSRDHRFHGKLLASRFKLTEVKWQFLSPINGGVSLPCFL